jgi:myosin-1
MAFIPLVNLNTEFRISNFDFRYERNKLYTYIGEVVVSVNPYKPVEIYNKSYVDEYKGREIYERPPHIFNIYQSNVHRGMWCQLNCYM